MMQCMRRISLCARSVDHIDNALTSGTLIITAGDRSDILLAACLAYCNGCQLAGILLTGGYTPSDDILKLCKMAFNQGLTVLSTSYDSFTTTQLIHQLPMHIQDDDIIHQRLQQIGSHHILTTIGSING